MKFFKILGAFAILAIAMAACTSPTPTPSGNGEAFSFKQGDYTVYQAVALDSASNPSGATYRVTRIIARTGLSVGGQTDAILVVDTTFAANGTTVAGIDSLYYRIANNEVYSYFDLNTIRQIVRGIVSVFGGSPDIALRGFTPGWVKEAELNDAAATIDFPTNTFTTSFDAPLVGAVTVTAKVNGRNQGRTTLTANSTSYQVHRQTQRYDISTTIGLTLNLPFETDFGASSQGAPRTIIRAQQNTVTVAIPAFGIRQSVPGERRTMTSFTAGK